MSADDDQPEVDEGQEEEQSSQEPAPTQEVETWRHQFRPALAEFVGSGLFVYIACGAAANTAAFKNPGPTVIAIALAFGLTIFVLAFAFGHISGAHLNPVVSVVFLFLKKMKFKKCVAYVLAQFMGALVGAALLRASTPALWVFDPEVPGGPQRTAPNCLAANFVHTGITSGVAFLMEIILTFFLLIVICAATDSSKSNPTMIPLAIGLCITCCHLIALPVDGCSLNPARSFASAAVAASIPNCETVWDHHWVFWFGPFFGGAMGGLLYEFAFHDGGRTGENLIDQYRSKSTILNTILNIAHVPRTRRQ